MRRLSAGLILAAVVVGLAATVAPANAQTSPETIAFVATAEQFEPISGFSADRPPRAGDAFVFSGSLYQWAGRKRGKPLGRFEIHVLGTSNRGGYLSGIAYLPGGQLLFAGFTPFREVRLERYAVIGGLGRYAGARGAITVRNLASGDSAVKVRLRP